MFKIKLIRHENITEADIEEVVSLKSTQWHFDFKEQLHWIQKNLKKSDYHVLLMDNDICVSYLNLVDIDLKVNGIYEKGFGIGNVCAIERGKGYGFYLMKETNKIIKNSNKIGLLFCKNPLLRFYENLNWKQISRDQYKIDCKDINVMVFNVLVNQKMVFEYDGLLF